MSEMLPTTPERKLWNDGPNYTADAVIIDETERKILLIRRGDCGEWALPGGFVDATDMNALKSAKREAMEEANIALDDYDISPFYHGVVDDPRNSEDAWIETSAYMFDATADTKIAAGDDAADARWFTLDDLPDLYASHDQIVARAIDIITSRSTHNEFKCRPEHCIRDVNGGHMGYDKVIHTSDEYGQSIFQKTFDVSGRHANEHTAPSRRYLQKEAAVMSHLRTNGYDHLPQHSYLVQDTSLFMEGYAPEHGWRWRAPVEQTDHYIADCLTAFDNLETQPIYPDSDNITPSIETFRDEGWSAIDEAKRALLRENIDQYSPHFQATTRKSARRLLDDMSVLQTAARNLTPPDRYVVSHHDARQSNIAWHPEHGARLVDWSWCGYGRPGSDATSFLIDMHKSGHDISNYLDRINPEHCVELIGFWLAHSTYKSCSGDHEVRKQQLLSAISGYEVLSLVSTGA